ncbi:MAG TPA: hexitol phosphatase HxpB [Chitinophagaceae bacterium]|nr:hexitol phosphatase HxpB [Chitinophagaceae bacterium]MCC6634557.1 hexitol phosphatase HxpB [Chitinophagaceae bacterium]HMZ47047.1 hexitol phosphatase HxpB [Chitinophagaceae bacterium]HNF30630.1 hexitol phosphatase HxpB [Chitinophagaceae bacterium]HNJ58415.1 hexitol phosphatase HxpB [Chitinophagaceae bacterium]
MNFSTVIFDMDGLLIDSEPLWNKAASKVFNEYGVKLSNEQYNTTTGLRTREFVQWWFKKFNIGDEELLKAETKIIDLIVQMVKENKGAIMPGVNYIIDFFQKKNFKIGLATSSPMQLIDVVIELTNSKNYFQAIASAENLTYGKPHPQVYLDCAQQLNVHPHECICFEDSFNGMIAAKAARMTCVVVPHHTQLKDERWGAADLKLTSLQNFGELHFGLLSNK